MVPINERDDQIAKDSLPPVGSFALIKDLVRDYTDLKKVQEVERKKLDLDSIRAFPGSKIAKTAASTLGDSDWEQHAKTRSVSQWGTEQLNKKTTLFRQKGLRDPGSGRFQTSTKEWLNGYDTVRNQFAKRNTVIGGGSARMNSTVGQAMFNLKRTLPPPTQDDANKHIRYHSHRNGAA